MYHPPVDVAKNVHVFINYKLYLTFIYVNLFTNMFKLCQLMQLLWLFFLGAPLMGALQNTVLEVQVITVKGINRMCGRLDQNG